jgi:hypothetical protein
LCTYYYIGWSGAEFILNSKLLLKRIAVPLAFDVNELK